MASALSQIRWGQGLTALGALAVGVLAEQTIAVMLPYLESSRANASATMTDAATPPRSRALTAALTVSPPVAEWLDPDSTDLGSDPFGRRLRDGLVITGATSHRLILFTFDDGPDRHNTPPMLDHLDAAGVRAVFFLTASRMQGASLRAAQQREIAREIVRRGHMVASHTIDHVQLPLLDNDGVLAQVDGAERVFVETFGERPWLFRPPGGALSDRVNGLLAQRGYTTVLWNLGAGDVQVETAEEIYTTWLKVFERRQAENGEKGGIILLHDLHPKAQAAFDLIMEHLRLRNCELLARGEELYDVVDDPTLFFAPRNGASPSALARPADPAPQVIEARQLRVREEAEAYCTTR